MATSEEQDIAAGGLERRQLRLDNGAIVTASVAVRKFAKSGDESWAYLQFKTEGKTHTKYIGKVSAETRSESLNNGWETVRRRSLVELYGWAWVVRPK